LIKVTIITITSGIVVGFTLLLLEYSYFIPAFRDKPTTETPSLPTSKPCQCTPGEIFRDPLQDGNIGPEIVVIAAGQFRMVDIQNRAQPVHSVPISRFAMSRHEITFAEYDYFAQATGRQKPDDAGWGRGNRPVINVSWNDATAFAQWLSQQTKQKYRLPTETEWEYAARAGTETQYWWGNEISYNLANCDGCGSQWDNKKTAPVGSFAPNSFELYDTVGNVYEWTCSEYKNKSSGKEQVCPNKQNTTALRVIRGGSWYSCPRFVGVANRYRFPLGYRDYNLGFRLVRQITKKTTDYYCFSEKYFNPKLHMFAKHLRFLAKI
jgi:formylglycine-generating enzyme required for sulfatase activity